MRTNEVSPQIEYIESLYSLKDELLVEVRKKGGEFAKEGMQIRPYEGKVLHVLLQMIKAQKVVEFGTFMGFSTLCIASALPKEGKVYTFEKESEYAAVAEDFFSQSRYSDQIELFVGDAFEKCTSIEKHGPFDAVFIDANKIAYPQYLQWSEKNLRTGGLVIADNTFLFGKVLAPSDDVPLVLSPSGDKMTAAMQLFNQELADPSRFTAVILPTAEGLSVAVKK